MKDAKQARNDKHTQKAVCKQTNTCAYVYIHVYTHTDVCEFVRTRMSIQCMHAVQYHVPVRTICPDRHTLLARSK